jgi:hypothetical protein
MPRAYCSGHRRCSGVQGLPELHRAIDKSFCVVNGVVDTHHPFARRRPLKQHEMCACVTAAVPCRAVLVCDGRRCNPCRASCGGSGRRGPLRHRMTARCGATLSGVWRRRWATGWSRRSGGCRRQRPRWRRRRGAPGGQGEGRVLWGDVCVRCGEGRVLWGDVCVRCGEGRVCVCVPVHLHHAGLCCSAMPRQVNSRWTAVFCRAHPHAFKVFVILCGHEVRVSLSPAKQEHAGGQEQLSDLGWL